MNEPEKTIRSKIMDSTLHYLKQDKRFINNKRLLHNLFGKSIEKISEEIPTTKLVHFIVRNVNSQYIKHKKKVNVPEEILPPDVPESSKPIPKSTDWIPPEKDLEDAFKFLDNLPFLKFTDRELEVHDYVKNHGYSISKLAKARNCTYENIYRANKNRLHKLIFTSWLLRIKQNPEDITDFIDQKGSERRSKYLRMNVWDIISKNEDGSKTIKEILDSTCQHLIGYSIENLDRYAKDNSYVISMIRGSNGLLMVGHLKSNILKNISGEIEQTKSYLADLTKIHSLISADDFDAKIEYLNRLCFCIENDTTFSRRLVSVSASYYGLLPPETNFHIVNSDGSKFSLNNINERKLLNEHTTNIQKPKYQRDPLQAAINFARFIATVKYASNQEHILIQPNTKTICYSLLKKEEELQNFKPLIEIANHIVHPKKSGASFNLFVNKGKLFK